MGISLKSLLRGALSRGDRRADAQAVKDAGSFHTKGTALTEEAVTNYNEFGDGQSFRAHISNTQLARTERFECQFSFPPGVTTNPAEFSKGCSLMAEEVQIPGMVLTNKEHIIGPWTHYRNTNMSFLGNEINITFYTDVNWTQRTMFESWMALCVNPTSKEVTFPAETHGEISINAMDMQDNYRRSWKLFECTPKVLNLIPMSMGAVGVVRTTLIVSAAYWESKVINVDMGKRQTGRAPNSALKGWNGKKSWQSRYEGPGKGDK